MVLPNLGHRTTRNAISHRNMAKVETLSLEFHRYGHMVQEYYVARIREAHAKRLAERKKLRTRADVITLQKQVRLKIRRSFGKFPPRTPLKPRITGTIKHAKYTIEKLLFESRPGFIVSANLFVPKGLTRPAPCVLGVCGHSDNGKASAAYQGFMQGLATKGFVGLMYDPIGQGERKQYLDKDGTRRLEVCCEHNMLGHQMALTGEFFGAWRAWDGIRALDYLLRRPETDATRVGITGNSGGGTMTTWLCGLDDRFTMAAPSCFITTFLSNMENEHPADVEQIPPRLIELGLDEYELFIPFAPRPLILLTKRNDAFDQRGADTAYHELRRIYRLLGAEGNIKLAAREGPHGLPRQSREDMYAFFIKHAALRAPPAEPRLTIRPESQIAAARGGSVLADGSKQVLDFTRGRARRLAEQRGRVGRTRLRAMLNRMLVLPKRCGPPHHRVLRAQWIGKINYQKYALQSEPGIQSIITTAAPEGTAFGVPAEGACALLVPHLAAIEDIRAPAMRKLLGKGRIFGLDVRGVGQSISAACEGDDFFASYDCDYFYNAHGLLLGEPYIGRRVHDVLSTLDWIAGYGYKQIHLIGRGMGAILALLAGVLDSRPVKVTLINSLLSWSQLTQVPLYRWPGSSMLTGVLEKFDLPDCYRAIASKLKLISPFDAQMKRLPTRAARQQVRQMGLKPPVLQLRNI